MFWVGFNFRTHAFRLLVTERWLIAGERSTVCSHELHLSPRSPVLLTQHVFLIKAALPKHPSFICNYQLSLLLSEFYLQLSVFNTHKHTRFNTHKRYAGTPFICIQWQWPCSQTNGQSIRSGKTAAKVFKNGQDRPWDATLKEPVPQLSRLLVSDWPNRGPALIAPPSSSSYTK